MVVDVSDLIFGHTSVGGLPEGDGNPTRHFTGSSRTGRVERGVGRGTWRWGAAGTVSPENRKVCMIRVRVEYRGRSLGDVYQGGGVDGGRV